MEGTEGAFTCSTCRLRWPTVEAQRKHCQTQLHAFNVRRKVVNMVPVTPAQYAEHTEHAEHAARGGDGSTKAAPKEVERGCGVVASHGHLSHGACEPLERGRCATSWGQQALFSLFVPLIDPQETTLHCTACRKSYASRCTMDQHLRSKKHVAAAKGRSDEELVETRAGAQIGTVGAKCRSRFPAASKKEDPEAAASAGESDTWVDLLVRLSHATRAG